MIAGEFDLSVGSVFALSPMLMVVATGKLGRAAGARRSSWASRLALAVGYINGWITLAFGIPSFVTTLGMLFMARSIATVLSGGFPPPFPANTPTWLFVADLGLFRASMLWYRRLRDHPRRDAALHQSRQLDLRHRRPAPGGRRHGHRHAPGEAVLLHAVQLPGRLRRHDHHLPPQVGPAGPGRGPGAAGDRRGGDRRHLAHRRHRLGRSASSSAPA